MADNNTKIVISAVDQTAAGIASAKAGLQSLSASYASLTAVFGTAITAGGMIALVKSTIDAGDELNKLSQKTGVAVQSLSALKYAGSLADVGVEDLGNGLKKLSVNMNEAAASGTGKAAEAFKAIGVQVKTTTGALRGADEVMNDVADRFASMEDGAAKAALAVALFGKNGVAMIPLLNQGSKGLKDAAEEAKQLGVIMGPEFARQSEEFNDNMKRMGTGLKGFGIAIASEVLPPLNKFLEILIEAKKTGQGGLRGFFLASPEDLADPGKRLNEINAELDKLNQKKATMGGGGSIGNLLGFGKGHIKDLEAEKAVLQTVVQRRMKAGEADPNSPFFSFPVETPKKKAPIFGDGSSGQNKFDSLIQGISERSAALAAEAEGTDRLTEAQKFTIKTMVDLRDGYLQLTTTQKIALTGKLEEMLANDKLNQQTEARRKSMEEEAKAVKAYFEEEEKARLLVEDFIGGTRKTITRAAEGKDLIGLREREKKIIEETRKLEDDATEARRRAFRDIKDPQLYQQAVEGINNALEIQKKKLAETTSEVYDYATSWDAGVKTAMASYLDEVDNMAAKSAKLVTDAFKGMEDALVNFVKTGKLDFKSLADSILNDMIRMQVQASITGPLARSMQDSGGSLWSGVKSLFGFAAGGIMTSAGPLPLRSYASGGIANSPQLAVFGEGRMNEAFVPLPDGRRIPVNLQGDSGQSVVIHQTVNIDSRSDQASIMAAMVQAKNAAVGEIINRQRRGATA